MPAPPPGAVPGIDVSHHQGVIDWSQVAGSGQRFAIAKATEGRTFVDPNYAFNKTGAEMSGLVFGAYHFARSSKPITSSTPRSSNPATWSRSSTSNVPAACRRGR